MMNSDRLLPSAASGPPPAARGARRSPLRNASTAQPPPPADRPATQSKAGSSGSWGQPRGRKPPALGGCADMPPWHRPCAGSAHKRSLTATARKKGQQEAGGLCDVDALVVAHALEEPRDEAVILRQFLFGGTLLCNEDKRPKRDAADRIEAGEELRHGTAPNCPAGEHVKAFLL
eukprot:CAMPEP_0119083784 /NCGR_PEP_ID=MMETSP1178-20130426/126961_1 /TAXON_ID=33656 /ORGANISM="unid sp, Strain CCMP2000" /LENGTH=174 /DNA_ID=CAMNT_0007066677 /DNA_START=90 /DNA_END=615 /DNA_ORIENTATION=-